MILTVDMRGGGRKPGRGRGKGKGKKMIPASPVPSEAEEEDQPVSDDDSEMVGPSQNVPSEKY